MDIKKTTEEYKAQLNELNCSVECIGEYVNASTPILHKCLICGHQWNVRPSNVLSGNRCPKCADANRNANRRLTQEQYKELLLEKNPTVEVIGQYKNANTKIMHHCLIHDIYWEALPYVVLKGSGCKKCCGERISSKLKKDENKYKEELANINPNVILVDKYQQSDIAVKHKCLIDGYEWLVAPSSLLQGHGCPVCAGNQRLTTEEYKQKLLQCNPKITVVDEYAGMCTSIRHRCSVHGEVWFGTPQWILRGSGCPQCEKEQYKKMRTKSQAAYEAELTEKNPTIQILGEYTGAMIKTKHKCTVCQYEWDAYPSCMIRGYGCPNCSNSVPITEDMFVERLAEKNPDITLVGPYFNMTTPTTFQCSCGYEWETMPTLLVHDRGCPRCKESNGERAVRLFLEKNKIQYIPQKKFEDCKDIRELPFDFYLINRNTCIEYDGQQHFHPVEVFGGEEGYELAKKHDEIKTQYCLDNCIKLIRISYQDNIEEELEKLLIG